MGTFEEDLENRVWADEMPSDEGYVEEEYQEGPDITEEAPEPQPKKKKKRRRRRKKHPFLAFLIFVLLVVGAVMVLKSPLFTITNIQVEGNLYYTPAQVIEMSGIKTGTNLLFDVKAKKSRSALLASPYIRVAEIERIPTHTIKIKVEERREYAAVSSETGYVIIDREGTVLRVAENEPELTIMEGITLKTVEEGKPLEAEQTYLLSGTLKLLNATDDMDLYFKKVFFSSAVVRTYIYDNYYCEGTPENIMNSLSAIKELVEQHFAEDINKGVIKVGTDGYLSFSPKID